MSSKISVLFGWNFLETLLAEVVTFIIGIILARILGAEEYGLCGLLMIFIAISQGIIDGGFGSALIQSRAAETEQRDRNTIFWFNVVVSVFCYLLLFFSSGWIAAFYRRPILAPMLQTLALLIVINALGLVQRNILLRELKMKELTIINFIGIFLSGVGGIAAAYGGMGAWSIIISRLTRTAILVAGFWFFSSWRPQWQFCRESLVRMWHYASRIFCISFIENVFNNLTPMVIGKSFSIADVGFYNRAESLQCVPRNLLQGIISRFCFPFFAKYQQDSDKLKSYYISFIWISTVILLLCLGGLAVLAEPVIVLLLTDKWAPCIPLLQIMCMFAWVMPIQTISNSILNGMGKVNAMLRLTFCQRCLLLFGIICGVPLGLTMLVVLTGMVQVINSMSCIVVVAHFLEVDLREVLRPLYAPLLCIGTAWAVAEWAMINMTGMHILQMFVIPVLMSAVYCGGLLGIARSNLRTALILLNAKA